eukprot:6776767-Prymnesium_polylepis.1
MGEGSEGRPTRGRMGSHGGSHGVTRGHVAAHMPGALRRMRKPSSSGWPFSLSPWQSSLSAGSPA